MVTTTRHWLTLLAVLLLIGACDNSASSDTNATPANLRNVTVAEAAELLALNDTTVVLDVRTPAEYAGGHIEGALNLDFHADDFDERLTALDPDTTYVLMCHSGGRSRSTLRKLKKLGFTDVAHLKSGIAGWRKAQRPEVTE